jgi:hypothetical protein
MRMKKPAYVALVLLICSAGMPTMARAGDGDVAAGVAGGLLGGLLLGGALAPRPYYAPPEPVYVEPPPPPYRCYWRLGRPYWDDWRGVWVRPRIRVCD